jgi:predicted dehydrogenase
MKCALIGYGYWGKVLLKNLVKNKDFDVCKISDVNIKKTEKISATYPFVNTSNDSDFIFNDKEIDAVIIATPADTHYKIVKEALLSGKHVLVEKPLACSYIEAHELHELAIKNKKILIVDHLLMYTEATQLLERFISSNRKSVHSISCKRHNNRLGPADTNVLWDLAPHDISVINYALKELPVTVKLLSYDLRNGRIHRASIIMNYASKKTVHLSFSWISDSQKRETIIKCKNSLLTYNENLTNDKKIKVEKLDSFSTGYDGEYLHLSDTLLPLAYVLKDFYNCVKKAGNPLSNSVSALNTISIIEAIHESVETLAETKVNYLSTDNLMLREH